MTGGGQHSELNVEGAIAMNAIHANNEISLDCDTGDPLLKVSRVVRAINEAPTAMHAIRAMLRGTCDLCGMVSASIGISNRANEDPVFIATETAAVPEGVDLARLAYPLDLEHPDFRSASLFLVQPASNVNSVTATRILSSLLAILASTLARLADHFSAELVPAKGQVHSLSETLAALDSFELLREHVAAWLGEHLDADLVVVRTGTTETRQLGQRETGAAYWPVADAMSRWSQSDDPDLDSPRSTDTGEVLVADSEIDGGTGYTVVAGRRETRPDWSTGDRELFDSTVALFAEHLERIAEQYRLTTRTRYLSEMQELTTSASAARNIDELCQIVHATVLRFLPGDRFQVRLSIPEVGDELIFDSWPDAVPAPDQPGSVLETRLHSQDAPIGTLRVESTTADAFEPRHSDMLSSIAQSTVGAFERHLLLSQVDRQTRYESALRIVAERVNATLDPVELINIASDVIFDTIECDLTVVAMIDLQTNRVRARSFRAAHPSYSPKPLGVRVSETSLSGDTINKMQQIVIPDCSTAEYDSFQREPWQQFTTAVGTPIAVNSEVVGIITVGRSDDQAFTGRGLSLLRQIAAMLSTALENAYSYAERVRHTRDLGELQRLSSRIASQLDLQQSLDEISTAATNVVGGDGGAVALLEGEDLRVVGSIGCAVGRLPDKIVVGGTFLERLVLGAQPITINDIATADIDHDISIRPFGTVRSAIAVPLVDPEGAIAGAIAVLSEEPRVWTARDVSLLTTLSSASAIALQNARHFEHTRDLLRASVESLAAAVEAKDPSTRNHSRHVATYSRVIAEELGLSPDVVGEIELAGLLHDVGKIGIPDSVLEKPGPLDPAEWAAVHLHPVIGEQILSGNPTLQPLLPMVRHHHERWDGNGYPDRLSEHHIPAGSAIIAVAEAFDTMTTHRSYQPAKPWADAVSEIQAGRGSQFAPFAVDAFTRAHLRGRFSIDEERVTSSSMSEASLQQHHAPSLDVRALRIFEAVANEIREGADLSDFLTNITHELREIIDVPYLAIYVRADEDDPFSLITSSPILPTADNLTEKINQGLGVIGWVARYGVIQNIPDVSQDNRYLDGGYHNRIQSELCVPLFADGNVIGVMNMESFNPAAFSDADERLMISAADHIANAIHVVQLHERIKKLSTTDALTGLDNHRAFYDRLVKEMDRAIETGTELSVAIMDVDSLKAINDSYGHLVGDAALRAVAQVLMRHRREGDVACRYGGDEFALILPDTSAVEARTILESLAVELMDGEFEVDDITMSLPTSSWGVATTPEDGWRAMELLAVADERMYVQKTGSRT